MINKKTAQITNSLTILFFILISCKGNLAEQEELSNSLYVTAPKLNIRQYAAGYSDSVGFAIKGEFLTRILKTKFPDIEDGIHGNWIYIVTQTGLRGFIFDNRNSTQIINDTKNEKILTNQYEFKENEYIHYYQFSSKIFTARDFEKLSFLNPYHEKFCDTIHVEYVNADTSKLKFLLDSAESYEAYHQTWTNFDWSKIPINLIEISEYCKNYFEFYDYLYKSLLNYYKTNDLAYLKNEYKLFNPEIHAKSVLEEIENETDRARKIYIANFKWQNAINAQYRYSDWNFLFKKRESLKKYWNVFLKNQSITAMKVRYINEDVFKD
ncbi:hypothetical protein [Leptospira limi]|uniref:SH3 domain-containing protein n=1 Tax=Leptospira limi TaxID=2950023 RepID=A0ABT3M2L5_9LEPT|nr:hypothetical protein [Leptospira limi]MCW7464000.1 hypothetical protein [Leptospira limi]